MINSKNINNVITFVKGVSVRLTFNQIGKIEKSHFTSTEFDCKCTRLECTTTLIDMNLVMKLEWIRRAYGTTHINCGYRCEEHNKEVGGSPNSQHKLGIGADIRLQKRPPRQIQLILSTPYVFNNVKLTVGKYDTFTHVDNRAISIIFDKRTSKTLDE